MVVLEMNILNGKLRQKLWFKRGMSFYEQDVGSMTHSSCNKILWNDVNSKTRVGMPCIGCTESDFPRDNMLETRKNIGIPHEVPLGVSKRHIFH